MRTTRVAVVSTVALKQPVYATSTPLDSKHPALIVGSLTAAHNSVTLATIISPEKHAAYIACDFATSHLFCKPHYEAVLMSGRDYRSPTEMNIHKQKILCHSPIIGALFAASSKIAESADIFFYVPPTGHYHWNSSAPQ
jgi:hypothetical protein